MELCNLLTDSVDKPYSRQEQLQQWIGSLGTIEPELQPDSWACAVKFHSIIRTYSAQARIYELLKKQFSTAQSY